MALFKCKMCGGSLDVNENMSVCECEYCGTRQTLPKANDEQKMNAMNRANHFRRQGEFDRAIEAYEKVLQNADDDAELYWSLALCKYGIEYVDDMLTGRKIPTCHRMQYTSILDDADYLSALDKADEVQKAVYKEEAEVIAGIQKGILDISNKEEAFDVFICYKETDEEGKRTNDSVLAQDIYFGLTEKRYKVFFSRITLEGKLGTAYEPYIFAALNSAKVMIVVGTKPEHVNAVWVKNEWSRFLMLMQKDRSKLIIPAYRDMDPYDLPDALSVYQSQDMAKLGFMQDLIRGVSKVLEGSKAEKSSGDAGAFGSSEVNSNIAALLKRGKLALEDAEWDRAYAFFDQVLNNDAECSEAYLGQTLAKIHVANEEDYIRLLLFKTQNAEPVRRVKKITSEQIAYVNTMLAENDILMSEVPYSKDVIGGFEYVTISESRQKQLNETINYFENDKLMKKALRFSEGNLSDGITKIKEEIISALQERLVQAQEEDVQAEAEVDRKLVEVNAEMIRMTEEAIAAKEKKYLDFVKKYNENLLGKFSDGQIKRTFESFGHYRDAEAYAKKIVEKIDEKELKMTQQTLPKLDDDRKTNLYDRANHFRRSNEFDKAMRIYEQILSEDSTDAEVYWSLVLCRYGIEYVEDPSSHKRVPTVNRTQYTSVYDDDNYSLPCRMQTAISAVYMKEKQK